MPEKIITLENSEGPFQAGFQRVMRMVPDKDKNDTKLQRLLAFRLKIDGEAATSEFLVRKIKELIECSHSGSFYEFIKDDLIVNECFDNPAGGPPGAA
jgi:hypothetical protein